MRVLIGLVLAALCAAADAFAADPFVVGVVSPLSGPVATVGSRQTAAIQWWADDVNAKGGIRGRKVELVICDDQGNPEIAVTCVRNAPATSQRADDDLSNHRADDGPDERGWPRCARTVDDACSHRTYGRDDRAHGGRPRASPRADGRQPCRG